MPHAGYKYGKNELRKFINKKYSRKYDESGYLTYRFIINCEGKAGGFQIIENDLEYEPKTFSDSIKSEFLNMVEQLDEWSPCVIDSVSRDSFMYISFRLEDGNIAEILP